MKLFFDTNKRTMPQQVKKNKEDIEAQHEIDVAIDEKIDKEIQDRTDADIGLQADIEALQDQVDSLGNVLTFKGSVQTTADLPASNNNVGDVYYVIADETGYVWIDDDGTERWEQLGMNIDLSNYATQTDLSNGLATKQDTLTAGTNISIIDNVISASGGGDAVLLDNTAQEFADSKTLNFKQNKSLTLKYKNDANRYFVIDVSSQYVAPYFELKKDSTNKVGFGFINTGAVINLNTSDGAAILDLPHTSGTLALTSDIPDTTNFVKLDNTTQDFSDSKQLNLPTSKTISFHSTSGNTADKSTIRLLPMLEKIGIFDSQEFPLYFGIEGYPKKVAISYKGNQQTFPQKNGEIALTNDYGYTTTITITAGSGCKAMACVWGKWQEITQTTTLNNCSMVLLKTGDTLKSAVNGDFWGNWGQSEGDTFIPTADNAAVEVAYLED